MFPDKSFLAFLQLTLSPPGLHSTRAAQPGAQAIEFPNSRPVILIVMRKASAVSAPRLSRAIIRLHRRQVCPALVSMRALVLGCTVLPQASAPLSLTTRSASYLAKTRRRSSSSDFPPVFPPVALFPTHPLSLSLTLLAR
ncbi:hypothetical protein EXIGLDRAFT_148739 [Exidia glandulosa HHB12029]|uniref:Uncharacterized protein n=1 Tax=Exidia glandulosa HHB12029 TaxID=1314781 RepID=A0A165FNY6_EXIGL|nr:hypothetical protein EXIGLDRAFT_148739 [Exidia glandulosa HHB12029]